MKQIGIIGGLGPESTIDHYKGIINAFRQREIGLATPLLSTKPLHTYHQ